MVTFACEDREYHEDEADNTLVQGEVDLATGQLAWSSSSFRYQYGSTGDILYYSHEGGEYYLMGDEKDLSLWANE